MTSEINYLKVLITCLSIICQECRLKDVICPTENDNLDVVPSTTDLAAIDVELATEKNREEHLKSELEQIEDYDFIFIDCPPSLGLLSINGLVKNIKAQWNIN